MDLSAMPWVALIFTMQGVLSTNGSVWMPQSITAVRGSCVQIPCRFEIPDKTGTDFICRKPYAFTFREQRSNLVFEGDLLQKDCTTRLEDFLGGNDTYFVYVECQKTPLMVSSRVQIIQTETPPRPELFPEVVFVPEGKEVVLTCSAPVPCPSLPPSLSWSIGGREQSYMMEAADGLLTLTSTLTFTASAGSRVHCYVQYPLTSGGATDKGQSSTNVAVLEAKYLNIQSCSTLGLYILWGVMMSLCLLCLPLVVHTFRSLSRRLTNIECLVTNTNPIYTSLQTSSISSDYDQLRANGCSASLEPPYENPVVQERRGGRPAP